MYKILAKQINALRSIVLPSLMLKKWRTALQVQIDGLNLLLLNANVNNEQRCF